VTVVQRDQGPIFRTFFPRNIIFRGKFRGISWKNDFSKLFPRKIPFFPNIFWGKFSAEFSPEIFPGKQYTKHRPQIGRNFTIWENLIISLRMYLKLD
jgi:hypothetical protein